MSYYNLCGIGTQHSNISKGKGGVHVKGSHYFQIRGRSDFSFRELTGRSGRQQRSGDISGRSQLRLIETLFRDPADVYHRHLFLVKKIYLDTGVYSI
jgi:hypothetical protein